MTRKILPVREVRENLSRLLEEAEDGHEPVMITRYGRPAGYLIGYQTLNRLLDRLEELEDIQTMREAEAEWRARDGQPFAEALAEVESEEATGR
ncbi:MAG: type II toxin-antitoxin system Phd/YefM family antitoxin [Candidatus Bipolaricaulia bacterium]